MIGLLFGDTNFPKKILDKVKKLNKKYFIIDLSKKRNFKSDKNSHFISIGQFGKIISLIKKYVPTLQHIETGKHLDQKM